MTLHLSADWWASWKTPWPSPPPESGFVQKAVNYDGEMHIIEEVQPFETPQAIKILRLSLSTVRAPLLQWYHQQARLLAVPPQQSSHFTHASPAHTCILQQLKALFMKISKRHSSRMTVSYTHEPTTHTHTHIYILDLSVRQIFSSACLRYWSQSLALTVRI